MKPFSQLSGQEKANEVLRWLLVPVASVAAVIVLILLARIVIPPAMARLPGEPPSVVSDFQRWVPRIFNGLLSGAFVFAGAKMAPRGRLATALVLATLWIGYSFLIHVFVHLGRGKPNYLDFAVAAVAALLAVALVGYSELARGRGLDKPFAEE
jgi:hypothetical protein